MLLRWTIIFHFINQIAIFPSLSKIKLKKQSIIHSPGKKSTLTLYYTVDANHGLIDFEHPPPPVLLQKLKQRRIIKNNPGNGFSTWSKSRLWLSWVTNESKGHRPVLTKHASWRLRDLGIWKGWIRGEKKRIIIKKEMHLINRNGFGKRLVGFRITLKDGLPTFLYGVSRTG